MACGPLPIQMSVLADMHGTSLFRKQMTTPPFQSASSFVQHDSMSETHSRSVFPNHSSYGMPAPLQYHMLMRHTIK